MNHAALRKAAHWAGKAFLCRYRLFGGVQTVQTAWPVEDASVGGDKLIAVQRGGDDQTVRRIAVHGRQKARVDRDTTVDWSFDESLIQQIATPDILVKEEFKPTLFDTHTNFTE